MFVTGEPEFRASGKDMAPETNARAPAPPHGVEPRDGDPFRVESLQRAVKHAGLAAHKQGLNLMFPDRVRDQGFPPWQGIGRRSFRFPEIARLA